MAIGLYLGLEQRLYWVDVVEQSKAEPLAWVIWKWSGEGYVQAWRSSRWQWRSASPPEEGESEARRVSERESMGMTRWLCGPPWPDRWGQHWCTATKWSAWPAASWPLDRLENSHPALMNQLTARLPPPLSPNLFVLCKNFINKSCRATCKLQLCFYGLV